MSDCKICNGTEKTKYVYEDGGYCEVECPCVRRKLEAENECLKAEKAVLMEFWRQYNGDADGDKLEAAAEAVKKILKDGVE